MSQVQHFHIQLKASLNIRQQSIKIPKFQYIYISVNSHPKYLIFQLFRSPRKGSTSKIAAHNPNSLARIALHDFLSQNSHKHSTIPPILLNNLCFSHYNIPSVAKASINIKQYVIQIPTSVLQLATTAQSNHNSPPRRNIKPQLATKAKYQMTACH